MWPLTLHGHARDQLPRGHGAEAVFRFRPVHVFASGRDGRPPPRRCPFSPPLVRRRRPRRRSSQSSPAAIRSRGGATLRPQPRPRPSPAAATAPCLAVCDQNACRCGPRSAPRSTAGAGHLNTCVALLSGSATRHREAMGRSFDAQRTVGPLHDLSALASAASTAPGRGKCDTMPPQGRWGHLTISLSGKK